MRLIMTGLFAAALAVGSLAITRASQECEFRVSPVIFEFDAAAHSGTITVDTQPGCAWTVQSSAYYLRTATAGGTGAGVIPFTIDAVFGGPQLQQARLLIRWNTPTRGQDVLVTQNGPCDFSFSPAPGPLSAQTVGWKGGGRSFSTWAGSHPISGQWRFVAAPDWITFTTPPLGVVGRGDSTATFVAAPNPSPLPRDGTVTFCSGATMTVHQSGRSINTGPAVAADFDGDGRADPAVYRPSTGMWWALGSQSGYTQTFVMQWGVTPGMLPMPGDYDGDNRTDLAVYHPNGAFGSAPAGVWGLLYSSNGFHTDAQTTYAFPTSSQGYTPQDRPLLADYNGDGLPDFVTYRNATGEWAVRETDGLRSKLPQFPTGEFNGHWQWGLPGDVPVPADYDGDGLAELAVWRPSNGVWFLRLSSLDYNKSLPAIHQWGLPGDRPIVGDFDGDRRADLCVWRPQDTAWYITYASTGYTQMRRVQWGLPGDVPVSGDYDGDGRTDLAVWRPSNGTWYILFSATGYDYAFFRIIQWGLPGDVPLSGRITSSQ